MQVVLLQVHGQDVTIDVELHQRAGEVFNIDLQLTQVAADRKQPAWQAEEGMKVIKLMDLRQNHSTAQVGTRSVQRTVVFVRMPARQVLADHSAHAHR